MTRINDEMHYMRECMKENKDQIDGVKRDLLKAINSLKTETPRVKGLGSDGDEVRSKVSKTSGTSKGPGKTSQVALRRKSRSPKSSALLE